MDRFARSEVEDAVAQWWQVGNVDEDWRAWTELFIRTCSTSITFWGPLHGRTEVDMWIHAVMKGRTRDLHGVDWYTIQDDVVVFHCQNRRDNPDGEGPPYWDFPGLSVLRYAGDGLWASEEDYWDRTGARRHQHRVRRRLSAGGGDRAAGPDDPQTLAGGTVLGPDRRPAASVVARPR